MSQFPDFISQGYQVIRELGHNYVGGRVTYLATEIKTQQLVAIKQFQFAQTSSSWSGFKAHEREIQVLQGLDHPSIPRYIRAFETTNGFCMVQEYKPAQSLAVPRSFDPAAIKQIAITVLEVLVYLQQRFPAVTHRDLKPENILVDEQLNVTLVDFGFARLGSGELAMSSIALGTVGFMPPEQLYNRRLSAASDLYGLGVTLICLLTGTKSTAVDSLIDEDGQIHFQTLVPQLSLRFIDWLEQMVQPRQTERYSSAAVALAALQPISVTRIPEVQLSHSDLEFTATKWNQPLTQAIFADNLVPDTLLAGSWEVAPHLSDPPHTPASHAWISISPKHFASNQVKCQVTIDPSKLLRGQTYERTIVLQSNSADPTHQLKIIVQTPPLLLSDYLSLVLIGSAALSVTGLVAATIASTQSWSTAVVFFLLMALLPVIEGNENFTLVGILTLVGAVTGTLAWMGTETLTAIGTLVGVGIGTLTTLATAEFFGAKRQLPAWVELIFLPGSLLIAGVSAVVGAIIGGFVGSLAASLLRTAVNLGGVGVVTLVGAAGGIVAFKTKSLDLKHQGLNRVATVTIPVLTVGLGISIGSWFQLSAGNAWLLLATLVTGLPLAAIILYPPIKRSRLIAKYRQAEPRLIKP